MGCGFVGFGFCGFGLDLICYSVRFDYLLGFVCVFSGGGFELVQVCFRFGVWLFIWLVRTLCILVFGWLLWFGFVLLFRSLVAHACLDCCLFVSTYFIVVWVFWFGLLVILCYFVVGWLGLVCWCCFGLAFCVLRLLCGLYAYCPLLLCIYSAFWVLMFGVLSGLFVFSWVDLVGLGLFAGLVYLI